MSYPFTQDTLFGQFQISSNYPATQVIYGNPQSAAVILLVNSDPSNTIYLSNSSAYLTVDATKVTPLPPQSSVVFDGTQDVFAFTAPNAPAILTRFPSGVSYTQGVGIIALANLGTVNGTAVGTLTPATGITVMNLVDVSNFASYDLNAYMFALNPGQVNSVIVGQIMLQWFDDTSSGIPVFEEDWFVWAGRALPTPGVNTLSGNGPMHGRYMTVKVFIPPTAANNATLQYINIFGSNRLVPYSDWRQNGAQVNPQSNGITSQPGGGTSFDNVLASVSNITMTANQLIFIPCGLYSGPAYYRMQCTTAALHDPVIVAAQGQVSGAFGAGTANNGILVNFATDTVEHEGVVQLPRGPTAFIIQGNAAGTTNFSFEFVAQQAA